MAYTGGYLHHNQYDMPASYEIDKSTILTFMFTTVDDAMKRLPTSYTRRPGVPPKLSDSEVVTLALYQEFIGESREDHFFRLHGTELKSHFPQLNERSRFHRRKKDLWLVIAAVRVVLVALLATFEEEVGLIDSTPVPVVTYGRDKRHTRFHEADYGRCGSKGMKFFGYRMTTLVALTGAVIDFVLTAGNHHDSRVVEEFLLQQRARLRAVLGDKGYVIDPSVHQALREQLSLFLYSPRKKNQARTESQESEKKKTAVRLLVETVNAQLQEQLNLSKHYAKSPWGLYTRIMAKLAAHALGMVVNKLLGRPLLSLASLAY